MKLKAECARHLASLDHEMSKLKRHVKLYVMSIAIALCDSLFYMLAETFFDLHLKISLSSLPDKRLRLILLLKIIISAFFHLLQRRPAAAGDANDLAGGLLFFFYKESYLGTFLMLL